MRRLRPDGPREIPSCWISLASGCVRMCPCGDVSLLACTWNFLRLTCLCLCVCGCVGVLVWRHHSRCVF